MPQPGRPDKPDAFWWDLKAEMLAQYGIDPTLAGPILRILKPFCLELKSRLGDQPSYTPDEVWSLVRDHIYGWPKPGKSS